MRTRIVCSDVVRRRMLCARLLIVAVAISAPHAAAQSRSHTFSVLAGPEGGPGHEDGIGAAARFRNPGDIAVDSFGNVYVADTSNHAVRKITPAGVVTTLAGGIGAGTTFFTDVRGVAVDGFGNVFAAQGNTIQKITPAGTVSVLAGASQSGFADGPGSSARFNGPRGLTADAQGNVYVADQFNHAVRKITPEGNVTTILDGLSYPSDVALTSGPGFGFVVADSGTDSVRDSMGAVVFETYENPTSVVVVGDTIYVADWGHHTIAQVVNGIGSILAGAVNQPGHQDGPPEDSRFSYPTGIAADASGNLYVTGGYHTIRKIAGTVSTFAGSAASPGASDGVGAAARFRDPSGIAATSDGSVFVADTNNHTIRQVSASGGVTTIAGTVGVPHFGDAPFSFFNRPEGIAGSASRLVIADTGNGAVRLVESGGVTSTLAGGPRADVPADELDPDTLLNNPAAVAVDMRTIFADTGNDAIKSVVGIQDVDVIAGGLNKPGGVAIDSTGEILIADTENHVIRKTTAGGLVTVAGSIGAGGFADGVGEAARFAYPRAIAVDTNGDAYVLDGRLRKITPDRSVTTFNIGSSGALDFDQFSGARGVAAVDGYVYVADTSNHRILKGSPALPDAATLDGYVTAVQASRYVGEPRQLDTSPQTATSWQWSLVQRPSHSVAELSSTSVRNPVFTPDVADTYRFRLIASNGERSSITYVNLAAFPVPVITGFSPSSGPPGTTVTFRGSNLQHSRYVFFSQNRFANVTVLDSTRITAVVPSGATTGVVRINNPVGSVTTADVFTVGSGLAAPAGLTATATTSTTVTVSWSSIPSAVRYDVYRRQDGAPFALLGSSTGTTHIDASVAANKSYLYAVKAVDGADTVSDFSNFDLAATVAFTDASLLPGLSPVKASHVLQLRTAVNAVRALAALGAYPFTDPNLIAQVTTMKSAHLAELRSALDAARATLGLESTVYTDPGLAPGTPIRAAHLVELRNATQ